MAKKILPSVEYLRQCLDYDPATGDLTWKERPREHFANERTWRNVNGQFAGRRALACKSPCKGLVGRIANQDVTAHRVIYKLVTGDEPFGEIDHIDGNRYNNRWENLRCVSHAENARNRARNKETNSLGHGVRLHQGAYEAVIKTGGKIIYLGRYKTEEQALAARKAAQEKLGFHPNHGRAPVVLS